MFVGVRNFEIVKIRSFVGLNGIVFGRWDCIEKGIWYGMVRKSEIRFVTNKN